MLECHPLSSQAFIPLQHTNFIVVVAPVANRPDINLIEAFHVFPQEGINFKPKVWHFPLIATENSNLLLKQTEIFLNEDDKKIKNFFNCEDPKNSLAEFFYIIANLYSSETDYKLSNFYMKISIFAFFSKSIK